MIFRITCCSNSKCSSQITEKRSEPSQQHGGRELTGERQMLYRSMSGKPAYCLPRPVAAMGEMTCKLFPNFLTF